MTTTDSGRATSAGPSPVAGAWVVRGIMPVISRLQLDGDGAHVRGSMDMWGTSVPVHGVRTAEGATLQPGPEAGFAFTLRATVGDGTLRLRFTNVGVAFDLTFDRTDAAGLAAHRAAEPHAIPLPEPRELDRDGLAPRPPMGWNSWYGLRLAVDDASIRRVADDLVRTGLRDAGYTYVTIDDGWQATRDARGTIVPNRRFPDMAALGDHLHDRGLRFGIYSSPGPATCADYTGSLGHEEQDAQTYAAWGVDFLKYDWCSAGALYRSAEEMRGAFQRMGEALRATGRPIVYSLCQYGLFDVARWGADAGGHLWRTGYDVEDTWESIAAIGFGEHGDRGDGWNDPDMLQIGLGGLSLTEYRTQMSLWCMLSAPLILSCDVGRLTRAELRILTNREVLAIDQDAQGAAPVRHRRGAAEVWTKDLAEGTAVGVFNPTDETVEVTFAWAEIGVTPGGDIRDLWAARDLTDAGEGWRGALAPHDGVLLRVLPRPGAPVGAG
jgi:alpha-galactosidase